MNVILTFYSDLRSRKRALDLDEEKSRLYWNPPIADDEAVRVSNAINYYRSDRKWTIDVSAKNAGIHKSMLKR